MVFSNFVSSLHDAVSDLAKGKMCILLDNQNRENEGDLVLSAKFCTPENINFIIREARGIMCVVLEQADANRLGVERIPRKNASNNAANFAFPVDATSLHGVHTGVSAYDRAKTISVMLNHDNTEKDLMSPGHLFPLITEEGGVLTRAGHTEASIELMKLAKLPKMAVICEIIADDGHMMRKDGLILFAKKHNIKIITIDRIIKHLQEV